MIIGMEAHPPRMKSGRPGLFMALALPLVLVRLLIGPLALQLVCSFAPARMQNPRATCIRQAEACTDKQT
jgi:hypothetical protein